MKDFTNLTADQIHEMDEAAKKCSGWAISMVARANSGHPAGSLSSMKMYMAAYGVADITPENCNDTDRDYVVVSHGHTSPAAYATLAHYGFVDPLEAIANFRRSGSAFQGHIERAVPGIDWGSGNLGQGLSAGVGYALSMAKKGLDRNVYVLMGDGEQPKGQVAEARRIAVNLGLKNMTALIDYNHIQISGRVEDVCPVNIKELWEADGWNVLECDGHSFSEIFKSIDEARSSELPTVIICHTVMGNGVSFMEGISGYHGKAATGDLYLKAMEELGQPDWLDKAASLSKGAPYRGRPVPKSPVTLELGASRDYTDQKTDNRSAFGNALAEVGSLNYQKKDRTPLLVFDCDLAGSVKTADFNNACPENFIQCGIQEHATATISGAASCGGVVSLWADFGVFGLAEAYNQQRLNDINETNLKLVLTHVGLDVGEDGMTHQCIDYVSLLNDTFGWRLVVPVDPNQTDKATRWALGEQGNICLAMGRSKLNCVKDESNVSAFGNDYEFEYGKAALLRDGKDGAIIAMGAMTSRALEAAELLSSKGIEVKVYAVSCPLAVDRSALADSVSTGFVVTLEDHNLKTGMGSIWAQAAATDGLAAKWNFMGVHTYGQSGPSEEVYSAMGLSPEAIASETEKLLHK